ncbi:hypothetical protein DU000_03140 [Parvibium lacunae]|uniref:Uncharacterized protein n=2 Tax=Parvibium lacunae TaxID=1888893 RepID=A0A368L7X7_9BURK|nr:hypothetical protein DU000_03140 [Parvibium lacunae]
MLDYWNDFPPVHIQARRIAVSIGAYGKDGAGALTPKFILNEKTEVDVAGQMQALMSILPTTQGRPDDPDLDFLDAL